MWTLRFEEDLEKSGKKKMLQQKNNFRKQVSANQTVVKNKQTKSIQNDSIQTTNAALFPSRDHFYGNVTAPSKGRKITCVHFTIIINMAKLHDLERVLHISFKHHYQLYSSSPKIQIPKPQCNTLHFQASKSPNCTSNYTINARF